MDRKPTTPASALFEPDEVRDVLADAFYTTTPAPRPRPRARPRSRPKPDHYEVICISLYREDLARLDAKVRELKRAGHTKMSRSALIRFALDHADLTKLPRAY